MFRNFSLTSENNRKAHFCVSAEEDGRLRRMKGHASHLFRVPFQFGITDQLVRMKQTDLPQASRSCQKVCSPRAVLHLHCRPGDGVELFINVLESLQHFAGPTIDEADAFAAASGYDMGRLTAHFNRRLESTAPHLCLAVHRVVLARVASDEMQRIVVDNLAKVGEAVPLGARSPLGGRWRRGKSVRPFDAIGTS